MGSGGAGRPGARGPAELPRRVRLARAPGPRGAGRIGLPREAPHPQPYARNLHSPSSAGSAPGGAEVEAAPYCVQLATLGTELPAQVLAERGGGWHSVYVCVSADVCGSRWVRDGVSETPGGSSDRRGRAPRFASPGPAPAPAQPSSTFLGRHLPPGAVYASRVVGSARHSGRAPGGLTSTPGARLPRRAACWPPPRNFRPADGRGDAVKVVVAEHLAERWASAVRWKCNPSGVRSRPRSAGTLPCLDWRRSNHLLGALPPCFSYFS